MIDETDDRPSLSGLFEIQPWMSDAACRSENRPPWITPAEWTDIFFPERGHSSAEAKEICSFCPVTDECLSYGSRERFGVWGRLQVNERRRLRQGDVVDEAETITKEAVQHDHPSLFLVTPTQREPKKPLPTPTDPVYTEDEQLGLF